MKLSADNCNSEIVELIKKNIELHGITQRELAYLVGTTEASMSRWMNCNRRMPMWAAVAALEEFGMSIEIKGE